MTKFLAGKAGTRFSVIAGILALSLVAACGGSVMPGPHAAGSTGMTDEQHAQSAMAGCMKYASQTYCSQHIYGK